MNENNFQSLRMLFLIGYVTKIVLWFAPTTEYYGMPYSNYNAMRFFASAIPFEWRLFFTLEFTNYVVFVALALVLPRRSVFISGACIAAFLIFFDLFNGPSGSAIDYLWASALYWVASILTLLGFLIKPPVNSVA